MAAPGWGSERFEQITAELAERVLTITLNRPERLNAWTPTMDVRLAAEEARIGFVFARRGIVPEASSSWFLPRVVGISRAMEWVATGRVFSAEEALHGGLVRSLHPAGELLGAARELAREIVENAAPVSVALARRMLWRMLGAEHP